MRRIGVLALALTMGAAAESQACGILRSLFGGRYQGCGYGQAYQRPAPVRTQCYWPSGPVVATSPLPTIIPVQPACPECEKLERIPPTRIGK